MNRFSYRPFFLFSILGLFCGFSSLGTNLNTQPCKQVLSTKKNSDWIGLSLKNAQALVSQAGRGIQKTLIYEVHDFARWSVEGVPDQVQLLDPKSIHDRVFRYYFRASSPRLGEVIKSGHLVAGPAPYTVVRPGIDADHFKDLTGVFVTTPRYKAEEVGLESDDNVTFVDFRFHNGTGVLQIENGIFLVPGFSGLHEWLRQKLKTYLNSGKLPADKSEAKEIKRLAQRGGTEPTEIPIEIIRIKGS